MKEWVLRIILEWAADYLTKERIDDLEDAFVNKFLPVALAWKDKLMEGLKEKAALSETKIDDAVVGAVDTFLTQLLDRLKA